MSCHHPNDCCEQSAAHNTTLINAMGKQTTTIPHSPVALAAVQFDDESSRVFIPFPVISCLRTDLRIITYGLGRAAFALVSYLQYSFAKCYLLLRHRHRPPMDNQRPHPINHPLHDEPMELFASEEDNVYNMSVNGIAKAKFHRVDSNSIEDEYWYSSSIKESTDHLLKLYRGYSWQSNLYFSSEIYECTLESWIKKSTTTIIAEDGVRLNDNFQRMLRKIISSLQYFHAKRTIIGCISPENICVFRDGDYYLVKFKRLCYPASTELNDNDYGKEYKALASMIITLLAEKMIFYTPPDVIEMLNFMSSGVNRREFINMHIHPALLDEKNRCLFRVFAYQEVVKVVPKIQFENVLTGWCDYVSYPLFPVLYYGSPMPRDIVPYEGRADNKSFVSFARFCRNACTYMETTGLSYEDLDWCLNNIDQGFFSLWFNCISYAGYELSWLPK